MLQAEVHLNALVPAKNCVYMQAGEGLHAGVALRMHVHLRSCLPAPFSPALRAPYAPGVTCCAYAMAVQHMLVPQNVPAAAGFSQNITYLFPGSSLHSGPACHCLPPAQMLRPGGKMMVPVNSHLLLLTKGDNGSVRRQVISSVSFSDLEVSRRHKGCRYSKAGRQ